MTSAVIWTAATACGPAMGDRAPYSPRQVESHLAALTLRSDTPGIQYIVVNSAGVVFEHAGGWADIDGQIPMDLMTTMMAYSMSKTITAVAVLQLVGQGKLSLDDPLARYVSSLPYDPSVTVRQLVSHTSGLPHPIPLRWVHPVDEHDAFDEEAALAQVVQDHPRLRFEPGTRFAYSNIGYWLLGSVVERVSGEPFESYVDEHIVKPLALSREQLGYVIVDPDHHAKGYLEKYSFMNLVGRFLIDRKLLGAYEDGWLEVRSHYVNGPAFGGLVGTARGFGRFLQDQLSDQSVLLEKTTRELLHTPQRTAEGREIPMTLGWHVGGGEGGRFFYKEGGGGGFHCMMRVYPGAGIGTVVMTNATGFDVAGLLDTIDGSFMPSAATP